MLRWRTCIYVVVLRHLASPVCFFSYWRSRALSAGPIRTRPVSPIKAEASRHLQAVRQCRCHAVFSLCCEKHFALKCDGLWYEAELFSCDCIALYRKANIERTVAIFLSHFSLIKKINAHSKIFSSVGSL